MFNENIKKVVAFTDIMKRGAALEAQDENIAREVTLAEAFNIKWKMLAENKRWSIKVRNVELFYYPNANSWSYNGIEYNSENTAAVYNFINLLDEKKANG